MKSTLRNNPVRAYAGVVPEKLPIMYGPPRDCKVWIAASDVIVISPYLRSQQTAQPTIEWFPGGVVEVWPVQEFICLQPDRWNGTLSVE